MGTVNQTSKNRIFAASCPLITEPNRMKFLEKVLPSFGSIFDATRPDAGFYSRAIGT